MPNWHTHGTLIEIGTCKELGITHPGFIQKLIWKVIGKASCGDRNATNRKLTDPKRWIAKLVVYLAVGSLAYCQQDGGSVESAQRPPTQARSISVLPEQHLRLLQPDTGVQSENSELVFQHSNRLPIVITREVQK